MTFLAAETNHLGQPIELYSFNYGGTKTYWYTSADENETVGGLEYVARAIKRGDIEYTNDLGKATLEIRAQGDLEVADLFKTGTPSGVVSLTIFRKHRGDVDYGVIWKGRILNVSRENNEVVLTGESIRTSLQNYGLRRNFQRQCPHVLYGADCGVNNTSFKTSGPISAFTTNTLTLPAAVNKPNDYFAGGYVQWTNPVNNVQERRSIVGSVSSTGVITILNAQIGLSVGTNVEAYPGCNKTISTCFSKFGNEENYGGQPHIPTKNPFDGTPMY